MSKIYEAIHFMIFFMKYIISSHKTIYSKCWIQNSVSKEMLYCLSFDFVFHISVYLNSLNTSNISFLVGHHICIRTQ